LIDVWVILRKETEEYRKNKENVVKAIRMLEEKE
jgi:hypothetical protein